MRDDRIRLDEFDGCWAIQLLYWLGFNPFRELVDGYQQMGHAAAGLSQGADHIQSPDGKWPGDGDCSECCSRRMLLRYESLTAVAEPD